MSEKITQHEDEIELIDILRVIWKRKYLIIGGTLACGIIAAIISLNMSKIYMINMILEPGRAIDNKKRDFYIDSPENVKSMIDSGVYNNDIIKLLKKNNKDIPKSLNIKAINPKKSNIIKVQYKTKDIATGIQVLNILKDLLLKKYSERVNLFKKSYENDLLKNIEEISKYEVEQQTIKNNITSIDKRIDELKTDIKLLNKNMIKLVEERDIIELAKKDQNSIISAILYNNMIRQYYEFLNSNRNQIDIYLLEKRKDNQKLKEIEGDINVLEGVMSEIKLQKDSVQNIQIIKSPSQSSNPVKPKIKLNIFLAILVGGFVMLFISFFIEYLSKFRSNNLANNKEISG